MTQAMRFIWFLPRNALVVVLRGYRAAVSPLYGDVCRYYPSCSAYALGSIQQRGVVLGSMLSAARVARCHPWAAGGVDDVKTGTTEYATTRFGFVTGAQVTPHDVASRAADIPAPDLYAHAHSHERADHR